MTANWISKAQLACVSVFCASDGSCWFSTKHTDGHHCWLICLFIYLFPLPYANKPDKCIVLCFSVAMATLAPSHEDPKTTGGMRWNIYLWADVELNTWQTRAMIQWFINFKIAPCGQTSTPSFNRLFPCLLYFTLCCCHPFTWCHINWCNANA